MSASKSDFQFWNFEVKNSAMATIGAIDPCAISERIAHREKSLEPVLA
jgi:hypothetical protein